MTVPTKLHIVIHQGATYSQDVATALHANGAAINLSTYTGSAQIRKHYTSLTKNDFTVTLANTGVVTLSMTANTTSSIVPGRYVYDAEITSNTGVVTRLVEGIATVTPQVTR